MQLTSLSYRHQRCNPFPFQTNVSFIENKSNVKGAAIYISSLQRCVWSETVPHYSREKALRWDKFLYKDNSLVLMNGGTKVLSGDLYDIATDTKGYKTNMNSMKVWGSLLSFIFPILFYVPFVLIFSSLICMFYLITCSCMLLWSTSRYCLLSFLPHTK